LCVISCPAEALAFDYELRIPFVPALHRCLVGCSTCATLCPTEAIHVPDRKQIQTMIERHHLDIFTRRKLRQRRKRFAGVLPEVIYPDDVGRNQN
jgi:Fe-S-cluster-containing hydrogenase component 2